LLRCFYDCLGLSWSCLLCAAGLSSLTSLKLNYVGGQVLPPDGDYLSRLRSLHIEGDQAVQVGELRPLASGSHASDHTGLLDLRISWVGGNERQP
jgi:hypothetical protein